MGRCSLFDSSRGENSKRMEQHDWRLSLLFRSWLEVEPENVCQKNATLLSAICLRQLVWNVQDGQFRVLWMSRWQFLTRFCSWWEASGVAWRSAWRDRYYWIEYEWYTRRSSAQISHSQDNPSQRLINPARCFELPVKSARDPNIKVQSARLTDTVGTGNHYSLVILVSIVVSIPACHAGDRGSIPRREVPSNHVVLLQICTKMNSCKFYLSNTFGVGSSSPSTYPYNFF